MEIDLCRIDEAVFALHHLGPHDRHRGWKGCDRDAMDRLHEKSFISNPAGKAGDGVAQMQCGKAVEFGPAAEVFDRLYHPYPRALLQTVPDGGCAFAEHCAVPFTQAEEARP